MSGSHITLLFSYSKDTREKQKTRSFFKRLKHKRTGYYEITIFKGNDDEDERKLLLLLLLKSLSIENEACWPPKLALPLPLSYCYQNREQDRP